MRPVLGVSGWPGQRPRSGWCQRTGASALLPANCPARGSADSGRRTPVRRRRRCAISPSSTAARCRVRTLCSFLPPALAVYMQIGVAQHLVTHARRAMRSACRRRRICASSNTGSWVGNDALSDGRLVGVVQLVHQAATCAAKAAAVSRAASSTVTHDHEQCVAGGVLQAVVGRLDRRGRRTSATCTMALQQIA